MSDCGPKRLPPYACLVCHGGAKQNIRTEDCLLYEPEKETTMTEADAEWPIPEDLQPRLRTYQGWKERMESGGPAAYASAVLKQLTNDGIELIERIAKAEAANRALSEGNAKYESLLAFYGQRFVEESRRADGCGVRTLPAESQLEIALKSQIEITNTERAAKENAERELIALRSQVAELTEQLRIQQEPVSDAEMLFWGAEVFLRGGTRRTIDALIAARTRKAAGQAGE